MTEFPRSSSPVLATIFDRRSVRAFTKPPVVFTTFHSK
jgi:hypothetical protein